MKVSGDTVAPHFDKITVKNLMTTRRLVKFWRHSDYMTFLRALEKKQIISRGIKSIFLSLHRIYQQSLDLILPPKCLNCSVRLDQAHNICPDCWKDLHFISEPMCSCCGFPFGAEMGLDFTAIGENRCRRASKKEHPFDKAVSAIRYDDYSRNMIIGFKHQDKLEYTRYFAKLLKQAGSSLFHNIDMIIPVPLHKRRYNQSALISRILASDLNVLLETDLLLRTKNTPPQKGNMNKRSKNVKGAFKVVSKDSKPLKGRRILLIDDVYTTGATAENCAKALKKAGADKVYVLTIYRVITPQNLK
jgi:ComF family protein